MRGAIVQQISKVTLVLDAFSFLVTDLMHSGGSVLSCAHGV